MESLNSFVSLSWLYGHEMRCSDLNSFFSILKRSPVISAFLLRISGWGFAQTGHTNIGFKSGSFNRWTAYTGQCCPVNMPDSGLVPSRHMITSDSATDTLSQGLISVTVPGSNHSSRLGNAENVAEGEALEHTFTVTSDSMILNVRFAVLLGDGLHPVSKQLRFSYQVTSGSAQLLQGCTETTVLAGSPYPGKIKFGTLEVLPWQTKSINLTGLTGKQITIRFETGDCGPGGHFGYAYVDCDLIPAEIGYTSCNPDGSMNLHVQDGLNRIWFNGSTSDSILILQPIHGTSCYYELNPGTGCTFTISTDEPNAILPAPFFNVLNGCDQSVSFQNTSVCHSGSVYLWDFGDSSFSNLFEPVHQYLTTGNYQTTLTVVQPNNCKAEFSIPFPVESTLIPELIRPANVCAGETFQLTIDAPFQVQSCEWIIVSGVYYGNTVEVYAEQQSGFPLSVLLTAADGCEYQLADTFSIQNCPEQSSFVFVPSAFSPNGDGINDSFTPVMPEDATEIIMQIFNRYVQTISSHETRKGFYNGKPALQGVYNYVLHYHKNSNSYHQNGTLSMIR